MKNEESIQAIRKQAPSDKTWKDEKGMEIPYTRTSAVERMMEKGAYKLLHDAIALSDELGELKNDCRKISEEIFNRIMSDNDVKKATKGNFSWFNFDRSIKVEVSINERITFDDALITACQHKLNEFLNDELSDKQDFIRQLVTDAFSRTRGTLDAKKVMGLLRHKQQIKAKKFHEALELLEKSVRRRDSKTYYRVSYRKENGEYQVVDLNFSSI